ncbi:homoserine dehydrogenase family protein [Arabidopsis lyrata subsp. lyrata]|uniref:Homoserine dehydrogenase n=1 Tax=Arabidopsis lyrata subsp. lyrata TaxID=81972 RepID=D7M071_ARALL|nr:homoserine dehydrogenase family protein [Arabidopsis lyrata subsp. lyrata]
MKKIAVLLMGCGGVGRHLLQHIASCRSLHAKMGVQLRVVGVCDSKSLVAPMDVLKEELNDELLSEVCRIKSSGLALSKLGALGGYRVFNASELSRETEEIAKLLGKSAGLAVVDCSASMETIEILMKAVDLGCCVVLANKKPLTSTLEHYDKLALHPRFIRHESTVGAGLPVIASLNRIISSGDPVHRIVGSLSGTLGYVMSELEDGKPLSQVVQAAKTLGYTEPDPRDDLSGMDVARKGLILARLLGKRIIMDSIKIESMYPEEMGPGLMSVDDFLHNGIVKLDQNIEERVKRASSNGCVLRYVCVIEGSSVQVGIREVPKDSPLGRLRGSDNIVEIYSRCYKEQPLVIQGAGAGNDTTAAGVLADIIDLQDLFH